MLSLSSRTCMPRSGAHAPLGRLRDTRERPPRMTWRDAAPQTAEESAARLRCKNRLVARCQGDLACEVAVGIGRCTAGLVLEDGSASFGRYFEGIVRADFRLEHRHVTLEAVAHRG